MPGSSDPPELALEVLGPLRLEVEGVPVEVPGPKRRAVLALLAIAEGRTVTVDALLDAVWPSDPGDAARAALHSQISRLRGHLGPAAPRLEAIPGAYRLRLENGGLDLHVARALLDEARTLAGTDPAQAGTRLRTARALWRGPVLADLAEILPIAAWVLAIEELRHEIDEMLIECALATGDAAAVVAHAAEVAAEDPLREPAVALLMRALAATGRTAQALRAGYDYRRRLRQETGLDASPALGELERELASGAGAASVTPPHTMPEPVTPLVGRDAEVAALQRLLVNERIVTVVGPGGVGKTRLAIEVARRHDDVRFLSLAPVTDADAIPHVLASALGLDAVRGDVLAACAALLAAGPQLLLIDNCEHLVDAVRQLVATLVEACPDLTVLTTSREPLALASECQVRLGPLPLPDIRSGELGRAPAIALFVDRAQRVRRQFAPSLDERVVIADIVRQLDGMPLSIELAASRLSSFGLADLHARLDRSLDFLGHDRSTGEMRHRTLRATLGWSYDLLPEPEQRLFRHLAVFPDGVDLTTAEMVAAEVGLTDNPASALAHLVDASMLVADLDDVPRYRWLETLRSFGVDRLAAAGEHDDADHRLVRWAVGVAKWIDATLDTEHERLANERMRRELPNLRAAWRLARRRGDLDHAIELVVALDDAAQWRDLPEVWHWARELADDQAVEAHPRASAALATASDHVWLQGDLDRADHLARRAQELATDEDGRWRSLLASAVVDLSRANYADATIGALKSAALSPRPAHCIMVAALAAAYAGDLARAEQLRQQDFAISPTLRAEREYVAGEIASIAGRLHDAEKHYRSAMALARDVGATFVVGIASVGLLTVLVEDDRLEEALRGHADVIGYWERAGNWIQMWITLRNLAALLRRLGDEERALYLEFAADTAPEAPTVSDAVWQGNAGCAAAALPEGTVAVVRTQASTATRAQALDVARKALADQLESAHTGHGG